MGIIIYLATDSITLKINETHSYEEKIQWTKS